MPYCSYVKFTVMKFIWGRVYLTIKWMFWWGLFIFSMTYIWYQTKTWNKISVYNIKLALASYSFIISFSIWWIYGYFNNKYLFIELSMKQINKRTKIVQWDWRFSLLSIKKRKWGNMNESTIFLYVKEELQCNRQKQYSQ